MYNDILFSGARRFMVCNVDQETGRMAEVGVIFYLDELKEVSEQTQDRVKYIGSHSVIGRAQLKRVLNPKVAATRETYLRAEVAELEDPDAADADATADAEAELRKLFEEVRTAAPCRARAPLLALGRLGRQGRPTTPHPSLPPSLPPSLHPSLPSVWLSVVHACAARSLCVRVLQLVDMQGSLGEEPRFTNAVKGTLAFGAGSGKEDKGLWGAIVLWQQFLEQRAQVVGNKMQKEIQKQVVDFLQKSDGGADLVNAKGEVRLEDLPPELGAEIRATQRRYREELEDSASDPYGLQFQALLQTESHAARLDVFTQVLEIERKRLSARATLQSLFKPEEKEEEEEEK